MPTSRPTCGARSSPSKTGDFSSSRHRSVRDLAGRCAQRASPQSGRGRQHDHSAACADLVPVQPTHDHAEAPGSRAGRDARGGAVQGSDSRVVPESRATSAPGSTERRRYRDALFGKRARDLTLAEAALVAALIRAPSALSPWSNPEGAMRRSHMVLATMREQGVIDAVAERAAVQTKLRAPRAARLEGRGGRVRARLPQTAIRGVVRRRQSPGLAGAYDLRPRAADDRRARRQRRAAADRPCPGCRRRWWR